MTIRQYLWNLARRLERDFTAEDLDRQIAMSDLGRIYIVSTSMAAEQKGIPYLASSIRKEPQDEPEASES